MTSPAFLRVARRIRRMAMPMLTRADTDANVPSPCDNVCRMAHVDDVDHGAHVDAAWCVGCLRTLDEIASWSALDDVQKRAIWQVLLARAERLERTV